MATKKPMKKPVKRVRRFQEGGEAALKAEGLAASNKTPMGFFERLRMGNIDQEGSEAYNRLGAGRGRMERDAASEAAANRMVDESRAAKGISKYQESVDQDEMDRGADMRNYEMMQRGRAEGERDEKRMAPSPVAQAQNAAILAGKVKPAATRPLSSQLPAKPAAVAAKPTAPAVSKGSQGDDALSRRIGSAARLSNKDKSNLGVSDRAALLAAEYEPMGKGKIDKQNATGAVAKSAKDDIDETKLSLSERIKLSRERSKSGSGPTDKRSVNERMRETFGLKKGGAVKKMASGGSVKSSTASKRGDGIALRGKTRGKIY
jgi:hypothetical protein